MGLGLAFARVFRLPGTIGTLIGAGTAICGGSAILALGPLVRAKDEEIAYAITTIFTFNIVALLLYPPLGHLLHLSSTAFGSWTGTAVNDTSVVVATGFIFSHAAGATATIVKLTRTLLLVPLAIAVGLHYGERAERDPNGGTAPAHLWQRVKGTELKSSGVGLPAYYDWRSRSGCTFCFFQQKIEWVRLKRVHPEAYEEAKLYEKEGYCESFALHLESRGEP